MDYRTKFYSKYHSTHTKILYGEASFDDLREQSIFWEYYYKDFLTKDSEATVLDLGCGDGLFVYWLQHMGYKNSYGIDISSEQVEIAKKLGIENITHADIFEFLNNKKGVYDMIIARDVIEHFKKDELLSLLELVYSNLKEGGRFIIKTPNGESPFTGRYRWGDFTHEVIFTWSSLNQLFKVTGFREVKFKPAGPVPHGLKSAVRYFLWKCIETFLRFYIIVETGQKKGIFTQNIIACGVK